MSTSYHDLYSITGHFSQLSFIFQFSILSLCEPWITNVCLLRLRIITIQWSVKHITKRVVAQCTRETNRNINKMNQDYPWSVCNKRVKKLWDFENKCSYHFAGQVCCWVVVAFIGSNNDNYACNERKICEKNVRLTNPWRGLQIVFCRFHTSSYWIKYN